MALPSKAQQAVHDAAMERRPGSRPSDVEQRIRDVVTSLAGEVEKLKQDRDYLLEFIAYAEAASPEVHALITGFKARARLFDPRKP